MGASGHYLTQRYTITPSVPTTNPISVQLPSGQLISNTHDTHLPIFDLPPTATLARIFPSLRSASLVSIGQLCDAGCKATFDSQKVKVTKNGKVLLTRVRNLHNHLWEFKLTQTTQKLNHLPAPPPQINNVYTLSTKSSIINFLHGACGFPAKSSWIHAVKKNFFTTWPTITAPLIQKHLNKSETASLARIQQTPKNLQSTKPMSLKNINKNQQASQQTNKMAIPANRQPADPATIRAHVTPPLIQSVSNKMTIHHLILKPRTWPSMSQRHRNQDPITYLLNSSTQDEFTPTKRDRSRFHLVVAINT